MESAAPDWADDQTQAELAAQYHEEFGDDLDEDGDPYGLLDFEGQFDSEDEDELRESIKGYRLGAWMDGLVDVFLRLEDDFPGSQVDATRARTRTAVQNASDSDAAPTAAQDAEASTGPASGLTILWNRRLNDRRACGTMLPGSDVWWPGLCSLEIRSQAPDLQRHSYGPQSTTSPCLSASLLWPVRCCLRNCVAMEEISRNPTRSGIHVES